MRILRKVLTIEIYSHTVNIEKISICLNRGRQESVGNDGVSIVCGCKYEMVTMTQRQNIPKVDFVTVILRHSFALRVIRAILWSSCFSESYGPKF